MRSKYLEDIGVYDWTKEDDDELILHHKFDKVIDYYTHRYQYGVDPRECYDMESAVYEHLYCLLMQFKIDATGTIDLHYHTIKYNGIAWYQDEVIDRCLNAFKQCLIFQESLNDTHCWGEPLYKEAQDSLHLLVEVLHYMWW